VKKVAQSWNSLVGIASESSALAIENRKTADGKPDTLYIHGSGLFFCIVNRLTPVINHKNRESFHVCRLPFHAKAPAFAEASLFPCQLVNMSTFLLLTAFRSFDYAQDAQRF
jgi:hypothetical protein